MIRPILIRCDGPAPDGRTRHEGTDNLVRPLLAAQHIISKRGRRFPSRNSAGYQPLRRRAGGIDDRIWNRAGIPSKHQFLSAIQFIPTIRGAGSLIPGLRRALQLFHEPAHRLAYRLHVSPFAAPCGLAVIFNGREDDRKKSKCPTKEFPISEKEFPRTT